MSIQTALAFFHNPAAGNANCAQAVAVAFGGDPQAFASCGSGRAPEGWCGAAYAAAALGGDAQAVEAVFREKAGSVTCREIRRARVLSCAGCVETATGMLQRPVEGGAPLLGSSHELA